MFGRKKQKKSFADAVIVSDERASLSALRKKAKRANTRFWGIAISFAMIASLIVPYMSFAAVAPKSTNVFLGTVIPGYSMGGVKLSAYGVDLNSWGVVSSNTVVGSNYGVWSGSRLVDARSKVEWASVPENESEESYELSKRDKGKGWKSITKRMSYSTSNPDGVTNSNTSNQYDSVSPYRTVSDARYWDERMISSNGTASAGIDVSLFADFIIVSFDSKGNAHILDSPDQVASEDDRDLLISKINNSKTTQGSTTATPYYIPLSALFDAYGINDASSASISELMLKIKDKKAKFFTEKVKEAPNLLEGTEYTSKNTNDNTSHNVFNPYPYSMVFSMSTDKGDVVSSIYNNDEAYVYFSPSSVYNQYIALRTEYERLRTNASKSLEDDNGKTQDPVTVFQLGYYLAEMSILEAYLEEALPQDMTRGYVGATEPASLTDSPGNGAISPSIALDNVADPASLQKISYVSLMYDFSHTRWGDNWSAAANNWRQTETDAIMDTLSTFGYFIKSDWQDEDKVGGTGVMQGITAKQSLERRTIFGIYQKHVDFESDGTLKESNKVKGTSKYAGIYTPTYYPIQQHKMANTEKSYRFQIIADLPYETLIAAIKKWKFSNYVKFSFTAESEDDINQGLENLAASSLDDARKRLENLAWQYEHEEEIAAEELKYLKDVNNSIDTTDKNKLRLFTSNVTSTNANAKRIDSALTGYSASSMNSDNVHDLLDVIRGVNNLKFETWIRYYNPIKSEGGQNDLFLTRVSPAATHYFPKILLNGYEPAGGNTIDSSLSPEGVSFDYFSLPSFAPCFAAHTSDDSYYGILNYELRPFYTKGFIGTLSSTANIPSVEMKESAEEEKEKLITEQQKETQVTNQNLSAIYIMAKRVAYLRTMKDIAEGCTITKDEYMKILQRNAIKQGSNYVYGDNDVVHGCDPMVKFEDAYQQASQLPDGTTISLALKVHCNHKDCGDKHLRVDDGDAFKGYYNVCIKDMGDMKNHSNTYLGWEHFGAQGDNLASKGIDNKYGWICPDQGLNIFNCSSEKLMAGVEGTNFDRSDIAINDVSEINPGSYTDSKALAGSGGLFDKNTGKFIEKAKNELVTKVNEERLKIYTDQKGSISEDSPISLEDSTQLFRCRIPVPLFFTAVYDQEFNRLLGNGKNGIARGSYYWRDWDEIVKTGSAGAEPKASEDVPFDSAEWSQYYTKFQTDWTDVALEAIGIDIDGNVTFDNIIYAYIHQMELASDEIAKSMINLIKDYYTLKKTMPSKMMNCLAWADYQSQSDSDAQYQTDPSEANVTINVDNGSQEDDDSLNDITIRSKDDAEKLHLSVTENAEGGFDVSNANAKDGDGLGFEGRLERGVENSTWFATIHPAVYTMTATIGRVNKMSANGTIYPYSGLANGRLLSGTDKYAIMQSHVIDYASIASGIAGDLASRTRATVVSLVEPQYAAIKDLGDLLNLLGGFLGEAGMSMLRSAAEMFCAVMFPKDSATEVATSDNVTGMDPGNSAPAPMAYTLYDGTTMNRAPASLEKYDPSTGKLVVGDTYNNSSSNYAAVAANMGYANAAGANSSITQNAGNQVLGPLASVYKLIQLFALILVLIFIGFIAFQNFYQYTIGKNGQAMIQAQTNLKTVIWRSIVAIFMIGLPPLAGGTGFEGGNFILLEIVSNIMSFIESIFVGDNGSTLISVFTDIEYYETFGANIFIWILFFLCCAIMALCFLVGTALVWILMQFLLIFFLFGPLVWALFIWPYNKASDSGTSKFMNLGFLSGGAIGNLAPRGHLSNFVKFSLIWVAWGLMFWLLAQIFVIGTGGSSYSDVDPSQSAEIVAMASGSPYASMSISSASFGLGDLGSAASTSVTAPVRLLLTTLVCVLLFILMGWLLIKTMKNQFKYSQGLGHAMMDGLRNAKKKWDGSEDANGNMVPGIKDKIKTARDTAKILKNGSLDNSNLSKSRKDYKKNLRDARKALKKGGELPANTKKFLESQGLDSEGLAALGKSNPKKQKELLDKAKTKALRDMTAEHKANKKALKKDRKMALGVDPETGEYSLARRLKNASNIAQSLGKAYSARGTDGLLEGMAQLGNELNNKALDKASDKLEQDAKKNAALKSATDKIISEGRNLSPDFLKNLDDDTARALMASRVIKTDADGKRSLGSNYGESAQKLSSDLGEKIQASRQQIMSNEKEKGDMQKKLAKMGMTESASMKDAIKTLGTGFDAYRASELVKEHNFADGDYIDAASGAGMTQMQIAREYMNNPDFRYKVDTQEAAISTMSRALGIDAATARKHLDASGGAMTALAGISASDENKRLGVYADAVGDLLPLMQDLPAETLNDPFARAEAIRTVTGAPLPALHEQGAIMEKVYSGTANEYEYMQAAAIELDCSLTGRDIPTPTDPHLGTALVTSSIESGIGALDGASLGDKVMASVADGESLIASFAGCTNNGSIMDTTKQSLKEAVSAGGAFSGMEANEAQILEQSFMAAFDSSASVEENMSKFATPEGQAAIARSYEMSLRDAPQGMTKIDGFQEREKADAEVVKIQNSINQAQAQVDAAQERIDYITNNPDDPGIDRSELPRLKQDLEEYGSLLRNYKMDLVPAQAQRDSVFARTQNSCGDYASLGTYAAAQINQAAPMIIGAQAKTAISGWNGAVKQEQAMDEMLNASSPVGSKFKDHVIEVAGRGDPRKINFIDSMFAEGASVSDFQQALSQTDFPDDLRDLQVSLEMACSQGAVGRFYRQEDVYQAEPAFMATYGEDVRKAYASGNLTSDKTIENIATAIGDPSITVYNENPQLGEAFDFLHAQYPQFKDLPLDTELVGTCEALANGRSETALHARVVSQELGVSDVKEIASAVTALKVLSNEPERLTAALSGNNELAISGLSDSQAAAVSALVERQGDGVDVNSLCDRYRRQDEVIGAAKTMNQIVETQTGHVDPYAGHRDVLRMREQMAHRMKGASPIGADSMREAMAPSEDIHDIYTERAATKQRAEEEVRQVETSYRSSQYYQEQQRREQARKAESARPSTSTFQPRPSGTPTQYASTSSRQTGGQQMTPEQRRAIAEAMLRRQRKQ